MTTTRANPPPSYSGLEYPVHVEADPPPAASRWLWLVKWLLAVPHYIVLIALWVAFVVLSVVAFFAILLTARYPRAIFDFNVGVLRWSWRVSYYAYGALATDRYPPFTLADVDGYPAHLDIEYPQHLSRGLVLVKWWLLAIPHFIVLGFLIGSGAWVASQTRDWPWVWSGGLLDFLVLVAAVVLLFTGSYPRPLYDLLLGLNRWVLRVAAYVALMTDRYPPFRLDQGAHEPTVSPRPDPRPSPGLATAGGWSGGRIASVVIGSLLVLGSLAMLGGGATAAVADRVARDDGFVSSDTRTWSTAGYAMVVDEVSLQGPAGAGTWPADLLGDVRVRVTSDDSPTPVFVGIARAADVRGYLDGVWLADGPRRGWVEVLGGPATVAPAQAGFWEAQASGMGRQDLVWTPRTGQWSMVVMRADGDQGLSADVQVGATLPWLPWVAGLLIVIGLVLLVAGVLLVSIAVHRASRPTPSPVREGGGNP